MFMLQKGAAAEVRTHIYIQPWEKAFTILKNTSGLDPLIRLHFILPFRNFEVGIFEETTEYTIRQELNGWLKKYCKQRNLISDHKPVVCNGDDWSRLKNRAVEELEKYYTDENIEKAFGCYRDGHQKGEYSIRLSIQGFFWLPGNYSG